MTKTAVEPVGLTTVLQLPRGYLSNSQIEMYLKCALQYYFRYILGLKSAPGIALIAGSSGHAALEANFTQKITTFKDLPVQDLIDVLSTEYDKRIVEAEDANKFLRDKTKDGLVQLLKLHQRSTSPNMQPIEGGVEKEFRFDINGIPMLGFIDLETDQEVFDHKFVSKLKSTGDADNSMQLTLYSMVTGKRNVAFNCLVKPHQNKNSWSEPKLGLIRGARRDKRHYDWLKTIVTFVADNISHGRFQPTSPDNWACNPKWCGYYSQCRGGRKSLTPSLLTANVGNRASAPSTPSEISSELSTNDFASE